MASVFHSRIIFRTRTPDGVRSELFQPPLVDAPGTTIDAASRLSDTAQLQWINFHFWMKAIHSSVDAASTSPLPFALHVPHSETTRATPAASAVSALALSFALCVPA